MNKKPFDQSGSKRTDRKPIGFEAIFESRQLLSKRSHWNDTTVIDRK